MTENALQTVRELGAMAAREGRPRCLDNNGMHQDKDNATLIAMAGGVFSNKMMLGNAWYEGFDAEIRGPQGELGL